MATALIRALRFKNQKALGALVVVGTC